MQSENSKATSAVHPASVENSDVRTICRVALTSCACALMIAISALLWWHVRPAVDRLGAAPEMATAQIAPIIAQGIAQLTGAAQAEVRHATDSLIAEVRGARKDVIGQVDSARLEVLGPDGRFVALQSAVLQRVDAGVGILDLTRRENVAPVLAALAGTTGKIGTAADTYAALPAQFAQSPAWLALQPEITCRQLDGSGYGGCWHSRVTALMGEAARVGGVFTQRAPQFVDATLGIEQDVHGWTNKYVLPHKLTFWGKVKVGLLATKDIGIAGLRGGVF